jgi:SAM-dependent methyltransferase
VGTMLRSRPLATAGAGAAPGASEAGGRAGLREAVVGWDVVNWSRALGFWESTSGLDLARCHALELGCGGNGGISLWLAAKGCRVLCSGYQGVDEAARAAHRAHGVERRIEYATLDACAIPYREAFDLVCYKSMLGRIAGDGSLSAARGVIDQIRLALKPGGRLLFAENLASSGLHRVLRRRWGAGKNRWRYFTIEELVELHAGFTAFEYTTFGSTGCLGRTEGQRRLLGRLDGHLLDRIVPARWHYIMAGIATK